LAGKDAKRIIKMYNKVAKVRQNGYLMAIFYMVASSKLEIFIT
jgi:hypothetical protein